MQKSAIRSIVGAAPAVENRRQRLKGFQVNPIATLLNSWQKQNLLLNIRGQVQQIQDLRDTGAADLPAREYQFGVFRM